MATKEEYAQLSLFIYKVDANEDNRPLEPAGWERLQYEPNGAFGFSYGVFRRIGTNEVVIAYTGTRTTDPGDIVNDLAAGVGLGATQTYNAAAIYIQAKAMYGDNISFTGHSLGGGLASVMAVWFNRPATVFDEAPFLLLATNPLFTLASKVILGITADPAFTSYDPFLNYAQRAQNVTNYYVEGEFLNAFRTPVNTIVGNGQDHVVKANITDMTAIGGAIDLHSQALLTAMLMSDGFRQSTYASTRIIPLLMDKKLYANDAASSSERNVLIDFLRSEQGAGASQRGQSHLTF